MTNYERRTYLGEEFRAWRESLGLRQRDVARIAHLNVDTVAAYELGKSGRKASDVLTRPDVLDAIIEYADLKNNYVVLKDGGIKIPKSCIDKKRIRNYKTMSEIMKRKRVKQEDLVNDFNITYDQINAYRAGALYDGMTDEKMDAIMLGSAPSPAGIPVSTAPTSALTAKTQRIL